jgi:hypothetical protein
MSKIERRASSDIGCRHAPGRDRHQTSQRSASVTGAGRIKRRNASQQSWPSRLRVPRPNLRLVKWTRTSRSERLVLRGPANGELASAIADNHHLAQHPMGLDAAPQCPFGGDTDWIRCDLRCPDIERFKMRLTCGMIGKPCQLVHCQLMDDVPQPGHAPAFSPALLR